MTWFSCLFIGLMAGWASARISKSDSGLSLAAGLVGSILGLLAVTKLGFHVRLGYATLVTGTLGDILACCAGALTALIIWSRIRPWLPWRG